MSTRQQILEATGRIYKTRGLARLTTREIARETGVAEGTLYKHFHSKEDILIAVMFEHLPELAAVLSEAQAGQQTIEANLRAVAHGVIRYLGALVPMTAALFADQQLLERQRQAMRAVGGGPNRLFERIAAYVEEEQQLGRLDGRQKPSSIATPLLGACFHYVFLRDFVGEDPLRRTEDEFVAELVKTLLEGAAPKGAARPDA